MERVLARCGEPISPRTGSVMPRGSAADERVGKRARTPCKLAGSAA